MINIKEKIVVIDNTDIVYKVRNASTNSERSKIIKDFLNNKYVGKELSKDYVKEKFTQTLKFK